MSLNEEEYGSDTDDEDYVPEGADTAKVSEEENSGDEEQLDEFKLKSSNKKQTSFRNGRSIGGKSDDHLGHAEEAQVDQKKIDSLWADFKKDTSTVTKVHKSNSVGGLSSLFSCDKKETSEDPKKSSSANRFSSLFDTTPKENQVVKDKPGNSFSDLFGDSSEKDDHSKDGKVEIVKSYDFAGETVKISKTVDADSKEATNFLKRSAAGGLSDLVGSLEKKQKMGCLDKSKLDWNSFVSENNIREELSTHNKGKDGYVEKQQFLERADLRQFEIEKAVRDKNRQSLMK